MPDVTIVAAWISADTGVGPAIASGSQVNSGTWADLPQHPPNRSSAAMASSVPCSPAATAASTPSERLAMSSVPNRRTSRNDPSRKHASPTRLVTKAFCAASDGQPFSYQKPISR